MRPRLLLVVERRRMQVDAGYYVFVKKEFVWKEIQKQELGLLYCIDPPTYCLLYIQ